MSADADHRIAFGGDASQGIAEVRRYRAEIEATTAAALKLKQASGAAATAAAGGANKGVDAAVREAERAAKAEERAWISAIQNEERARKEAAKLASALRKDEERELKAFADRQRAQTKATLADQAAAAKAAAAQQRASAQSSSQAFSAVSGILGINQITAGLLQANLLTKGLSEAWNLVTSAIGGAVSAVEGFIEKGIDMNSQFEQARLNIASMVSTFYDVRNAQGTVLTGMDALNASLTIAQGIAEDLQKQAFRTNLTTQQLVDIYKAGLPAFAKQHIELDKTVALTTKLAQTAQAVGIEEGKIGQQIFQLVSGHIRINTQLAQRLQISKEDIGLWAKQGTLVDNLNKKIEQFARAGDLNTKTFKGLTSNLQDAFEIISRLSTAKLFDQIKTAAGIFVSGLVNPLTGEFTPAVERIISTLDSALGRFGPVLITLSEGLVSRLDTITAYLDSHPEKINKTIDNALNLLGVLGGIEKTMERIVGNEDAANEGFSVLDATIATAAGGLYSVDLLIRGIGAIITGFVPVLENGVLAAVTLIKIGVDAINQDWVLMAQHLQVLTGLAANFARTVSFASNVLGFGSGSLAGGTAGVGSLKGGAKGQFRSFSTTPGAFAGEGGAGGKDGAAKKAADESKKAYDAIAADLEKMKSATADMLALSIRHTKVEQETYKLEQDREAKLKAITDWSTKELARTKDVVGTKSRQLALETQLNTEYAKRLAAITQIAIAEQDRAARAEILAANIPVQNVGAPPLEGAQRDATILAQKIDAIKADVADTYAQIDAGRRTQIENLRVNKAIGDEYARQLALRKSIGEELNAALGTEQKFYEETLKVTVDDASKAAGASPIGSAQAENLAQINEVLGAATPLTVQAGTAVDALNDRMVALGISVHDVGDAFGYVNTSIEGLSAQVETLADSQGKGGGLGAALVHSFKAIVSNADFATNAVTQFAQGMGAAFAAAINDGENFGKAMLKIMLGVIADLMIEWGALHIKLGIANSLNPLTPGSGAGEIAAGIALVAAGAALKGLAAGIDVGGGNSASASGASGSAAAGGGGAPTQPKEKPTPRVAFNTSGEQAFALKIEGGRNVEGQLVSALLRLLEDRGALTTRTIARGRNRNISARRA